MQGQRSAVGSLPEVLGFEHGSTSSDTGLDQQMHWNSIRNSSQNMIPDYMASSTASSVGFLNAVNQPRQILSGWDFGESSSRGGQGGISEIDQKTEHGWSSPSNVCTGVALGTERQQYGSCNILSLNNVDVNMHSNGNANETFFVQNSVSENIPGDLNMNSGFIADGPDDDCQVLECPNAFKSSGTVNERMPFASSSSNPFGMSSGTAGFLVEEGEGRAGCSLDGRRLSCKRKTLEGNAGQSSGSGSSNFIQRAESSLWQAASASNNASSSTNIAVPTGNNLGVNLPEQVNPRLGLSVGQASSDNPPTLTALGTAENSRRNFRLRINASHQQDSLRNNMFTTETDVGNSNISSAQHSLRWLPRNNSLDLRSTSALDNGSPQGQPVVVHVPSVRRNPHSRWNGASGSRTVSSSNFANSGDTGAAPFEDSSSASVQRSISQHPMFVPPIEMRNSSQTPPNWNLAGGNVGNPGSVASTSRTGSSAGVHSSTPTWTPQRNTSQYPRRLSEFVRRSLSSSAGSESGGQSSNYPSLRSGTSSQDMAFPSGSGSHGRHASSSRSAMLLERHLDTAFGTHSLRNLAAATEGRNRLMSEIRNVLDFMRRREGMRFEDVMVLDQSVFFGMPDIHDRHRDMRLDVDNMSYEELLALEERIGNVSTGLNEETILKQLKKRKYVSNKTAELETEPCCVCQEEYTDGEDIGTLDCGHDFHAECIKQWLAHKNICPICKTAGLAK